MNINFFKLCKLSLLIAATFVPLSVPAGLPAPQMNGATGMTTISPMLQKVLPAIVNIAVQGELPPTLVAPVEENQRGPATPGGPAPNESPIPRGGPEIAPPRKFDTLGSGVIIDAEQGYIITNAHVLRDAKTITVTLRDGRQVKAEVIGVDPPSDIAVIQIKAKRLTALPLGNSDDTKVGDFVVAVGNPFGLNQSVTSGIVSAIQRSGLGIEGYENFIQTDASINPGNSGGALVDLQGNLIGINTAILSPEGGNIGIGFAIPANMAKGVSNQLIKFGAVKRGLMGVMIQNVTPALADVLRLPVTEGAIVAQVSPNSAAAKSGILAGDIIQNIEGAPMKNASQVTNTVALLRVGARVHLQLLRNNKPMTVELLTSDPESYTATTRAANPYFYGLNLRNYEEEMSGLGHIAGVQITRVLPDSPASKAMPVGVHAGDIITSVNLKPVRTIVELMDIAKNSKSGIVLGVQRKSDALFIVLTPP